MFGVGNKESLACTVAGGRASANGNAKTKRMKKRKKTLCLCTKQPATFDSDAASNGGRWTQIYKIMEREMVGTWNVSGKNAYEKL